MWADPAASTTPPESDHGNELTTVSIYEYTTRKPRSARQAFHLPISTLRDWEQRRSTPDAPERALLLAIERDPEAMKRLLTDAAA